MIKKWRQLPREDRLKYQAVVGLLIIAIYCGLFMPRSVKRISEAEKMLSRRMNRLETRASMDKIGGSGLTPKTVEKKIADVEEQIVAVNASFDELDTGFAPENSSAMRQQLMLEISKLADRTGLEIITARRKGYTAEGGDSGSSIIDPLIDRPLLAITAQAPFDTLQEFLQGLKDLSFHMAVMKLKIYSGQLQVGTSSGKSSRPNTLKDLPAGYLFIDMEVSI